MYITHNCLIYALYNTGTTKAYLWHGSNEEIVQPVIESVEYNKFTECWVRGIKQTDDEFQSCYLQSWNPYLFICKINSIDIVAPLSIMCKDKNGNEYYGINIFDSLIGNVNIKYPTKSCSNTNYKSTGYYKDYLNYTLLPPFFFNVIL